MNLGQLPSKCHKWYFYDHIHDLPMPCIGSGLYPKWCRSPTRPHQYVATCFTILNHKASRPLASPSSLCAIMTWNWKFISSGETWRVDWRSHKRTLTTPTTVLFNGCTWIDFHIWFIVRCGWYRTHSILDFCRHSHKCLLDISGIFGARL